MAHFFKGTLIRWYDDKGYGFISADNKNHQKEIFIHISEFKSINHRPNIGDIIYYQTKFDSVKNKIKAINAKIASPAAANNSNKNINYGYGSKFIYITFIILAIILIGIIAYDKYSRYKMEASQNLQSLSQKDNIIEQADIKSSSINNNYKCDGRTHCS